VKGLALAVRPLRHFADFSGRSTRSEVAAFYLLAVIAYLAIGWGELASLDLFAIKLAQLILVAALACPILALVVRRLHDSGWPGWWALVSVPLLALALANAYVHLHDPLAPSLRMMLPFPVRIALAACAIVTAVLLLWSDEPDANRYGPNPRNIGAGEEESRP